MPPGRKSEWDLPSLRETIVLNGQDFPGADIEDAKFYPYTQPGVDPILAVCNVTHILVLRMPAKKSDRAEIIQAIHDDDMDAGNNSIAWSKTKDGTPLLLFSGRNANIKVVNALNGKLVQTLVGHGGGVNDLVVSPVNPEILASCSEDLTIRIWSLDPEHAEKPCATILAGGGHQATLLSIAFHASGRYLLSSGDDQVVNMWTLPEYPNENTGTDHPNMIHYPHFSSSEIHANYIDCVSFYGDLILSKAFNENCIVLWQINGFSSRKPPLPQSLAPTHHDKQRDTRSSYAPPNEPQYTRLLQFVAPDCNEIYMRFSVYSPLTTTTDHPILALCSSRSDVMFWDLARLTDYHDFISDVYATPNTSVPKPSWLTAQRGPRKAPSEGAKDHLKRVREGSPTDSTFSKDTESTDTLTADSQDFIMNKEIWDGKYAMGKSRFVNGTRESHGTRALRDMIQPHKKQIVTKVDRNITGRQVAWSVGGEWCVIVGSPNVIAIFQRWADGSIG